MLLDFSFFIDNVEVIITQLRGYCETKMRLCL